MLLDGEMIFRGMVLSGDLGIERDVIGKLGMWESMRGCCGAELHQLVTEYDLFAGSYVNTASW